MSPYRSPAATLALALVFAAGVGAGCAHTHTVTDTGASKPADKPAAKHRDDISADAPGRTIRAKSGTPLATSPAGLLEPEAVKEIQKKLVSHGQLAEAAESGKLDGPTEKALRQFQHANNMPATGMPDDLTIQKLGLKPTELTRAATKSE
ncbi:MAG TPA: peptidoglycan-binding domain-containing protein [Polyangia bacterium]|nr:peptidoglycan-binding domain-containing protein [Polyangia bacterium]